jgi:hypothetical protein
MRRWIERLPPAMQHQEVYQREYFGRAFLAWEHEAHCVICGRREFMPGNDAPDSENEAVYDEDDEDEEMKDLRLAGVKLEDVIPDNYDENTATAAAMAASLADEDANWLGLEDVVQLSAMVAAHVASLSPPPPRATIGSVGH